MSTILDGKALADKLIDEIREEAAKARPKLAVLLVGEHPASLAYVRNKKKACERAGIEYDERKFPDTLTQEALIEEIHRLNEDESVHGFIVQLPLPKSIYVPDVIRAIDPKKDVDGFHAYNIGKMFLSPDFEDLPPATPAGIVRLLDHYDIPLRGKEVVVVGASNIVGKPIAVMLLNRSATVTVCNAQTADLAFHTRRADILVVAVGKRDLITADMVKEGAAVVDVGINRKEDGKLCGDVDFDGLKDKVGFITPVPGGVGPMTVAALILNTVRAAKLQKNPRPHSSGKSTYDT